MKDIIKLYCIMFSLIFFLGSCGDSLISDLNDFKPTTPPVITSFNNDAGGERYPGMAVNLTVKAYDGDNDPIDYSFSSAYGTFRSYTKTTDGCAIQFILSIKCTSSESIPITVTASDDKQGSSSRQIDIGDGNAIPGITIVQPPVSTDLNPSDSDSVKFSVNYSGYYQVIAMSGYSSAVLDFDKEDEPCYVYTRGSNVTVNIVADTGTDNGTNKYLESVSGGETYTVYIIFLDNFKRQAEVSYVFNIP